MTAKPGRIASSTPLKALAFTCAAFAILSTAGCPDKKKTTPFARSRRKIPGKVAIYTESSPVKAVAAAGGNLWVGTHNGLVKWDLKSGGAMRLTTEEGLPGNEILAMASDGRGGLWVATSGGVAKYTDGTWRQFGDCPLGTTIEALTSSSDASGVWVGGQKGLSRYLFGRWQQVVSDVQVTSLLTATKGDAVWVGTRSSGVWKCSATGCDKYGPKQGLGFANVRKLSFGVRSVLAVGSTDKGDRLAAFLDDRWYTYGVKPRVLLEWVRFAMGKIFLAAGGDLYTMKLSGGKKGKIRLIGPEAAPTYRLRRSRLTLPSDVTQVAGALGYLWIGTQSLGVTRYDGERYVHYRTRDLAAGARYLSVACHGPIDCYVANGVSAYRFDGTVWNRMGPMPDTIRAQVQYFVKSPDGRLVSIYRNESGQLQVAELKDGQWVAWKMESPVKGPGPLGVAAAGFDRAKQLWIGLRVIDQQGDTRGFGTAVVDSQTGQVTYHRNFQGSGTPTEGSLSLPNEVTGYAFKGNAVWIGSTSGVCRVKPGPDISCYSEAQGLSSDLIRAILVGPNGSIWVSSVEGINEFTGDRFVKRLDPGLDGNRLRKMARGKSATVWLGGISGLARWDKGRAVVYTRDSGLLETRVKDVTVDGRGRVWALHPGGITVITPSD